MATQQSRSAARYMMAPAVFLLLVWMLVPLSMTLFFSFKKYLPLRGDSLGGGLDWVGFRQLRAVCQFQLFLAIRADNLGACRRHYCDHRRAWNSAGYSSGSAALGTGYCSNSRNLAVLRDADRFGAGLEKHAHGSG